MVVVYVYCGRGIIIIGLDHHIIPRPPLPAALLWPRNLSEITFLGGLSLALTFHSRLPIVIPQLHTLPLVACAR